MHSEKKREAREKAESALTELRSGAEFQGVAQKYANDSHESMKPRWIARGSSEKGFDKVVFSLELGESSQILEQGDAFYIVKVLEKKPGYFKPYSEIFDQLRREYRWQKGEDYLKDNRDRILFTINGRPYTIGDFINEYTRETPLHPCHHMGEMGKERPKEGEPPKLCDFAHNEFEEQKKIVDRMIDKELIVEDTYSQMIHVEHQKEIEFLTMASLYPLFHKEEMEKLIHITDEMVQDHYQENRGAYMYPAKAKISVIVVKGGEKDEDKRRASEKAMKAYKELKPSILSFKRSKEFADVARRYSDDAATASRGGRIDVDVYECRNAVDYMLFHGFHKKIFELKPGDISDVFEFGGNYYIVQIREIENRKDIPFEKIRQEVRKGLMAQEHKKVMTNWEDDLLRSAGFVVYDKALEAMLAETGDEDSQKVRGS